MLRADLICQMVFWQPAYQNTHAPEARKIENTLRQFGFGNQCDKLILSLNRAAEDAAGKAVPIFVNAITSMSINDGLGILRGETMQPQNFKTCHYTIAHTSF